MDIRRFRKGITTIIAGEIVGFVTFILFGISLPILTFIAENIPYINTGLTSTFTIVMLAFILLAAVGMSVSMIVVLCGLIRLRKKDRKFKEAIIFAVIPLILSIMRVFVSTSFDEIITIVANLFDIWLIVTIIEACINVSDRLGYEDMADRGIKVLRIAISFYFISIIMRMIYTFLMANASYSAIGIIISAIASVLELLMEIFYIGYLIKVKRAVCATSDDSGINTNQPLIEAT